jgi:hypothetical protein
MEKWNVKDAKKRQSKMGKVKQEFSVIGVVLVEVRFNHPILMQLFQ